MTKINLWVCLDLGAGLVFFLLFPFFFPFFFLEVFLKVFFEFFFLRHNYYL